MIGKLIFEMIKFIDFLDRQKYRYNKAIFLSNDSMYRAKIINQYLRKFKVYCNKYPDTLNDLKQYEDEIWEYEKRAGIKKYL